MTYSWDRNVYSHPEKLGLTMIGEIDWAEESWSFDLTVVWRDETGQLFTASDSGCSCPAPFEDIASVDELEKVTRDQLATQLNERMKKETRDCSDDVARLMELVIQSEKSVQRGEPDSV